VPVPRRVPQRTCVVCRSTTAKRELVRVVRTPAGSVDIDLSGKANGRGAYLCNSIDCWDSALKRDRLSTALKVKVSAESRAKLAEFAAGLKEISPVSG
jgi:predicted RNA-binding protein YlxR (DUF448 family)